MMIQNICNQKNKLQDDNVLRMETQSGCNILLNLV